jgi:hypothetical protein
MNTTSEVRGVLAQIADDLSQTLDAEGYRRLLTQAANHLLPIAHPTNDLCHAINSRRDTWSSINASRDQRHKNGIRRWEEYDRDHGVLARSRTTRVESAVASTSGPFRGRSRRHTTCKENGPRAIWLSKFWCLMINTICGLTSFLVFMFVVHRMQELLGLRI